MRAPHARPARLAAQLAGIALYQVAPARSHGCASHDGDLALVLLGGDAGLRRGEIAALEWPDVDLANGVLTVRHTVYKGHLTLPKGGRSRKLSMTKKLVAALKAIKPEGSPPGAC